MDRKPRIGLLGLMLELYDRSNPELKTSRAVFAEKLVQRLQSFADVTWSKIAVTREEVESRVADFRRDDVDIIAVVHFSYSPSLVSLPSLVRTDIPVVLLNTQELAGVDDTFCSLDMMENHGMHGQQDLANTLLRAGKPFGVVTGHWEEEQFIQQVQDWAQAAVTDRFMRQAEIGIIGWPFQDMGDFGLDETAFMARLGPHIQRVPLNMLADEFAAAPQAAVDELVADYHRSYAVSDELTAEEIAATARIEYAVRCVAKRLRLNGLSVHYEVMGQDPRFSALPFAAAARLLGEGVSFGGEGDVSSAACVLLLHRLAGIATFSEMFTMDLAGGTVFMSHYAEANPLMAKKDQPIQMIRRPGWVGSGGPCGSLAFTFESGPVTLVNLAVGADGDFHFITATGTLEAFLVPGQPTPHGKFRPDMDIKTFLTRYLELGGTHHVAIAPGDQTRRLEIYSRLANIAVDRIEG